LSDRDGELIVPVIEGSRRDTGMPAIPMSAADARAVAAYIRGVVATIGRQGMPPSVGKAPENVLVGDAAAGRKYFAAKCGACHSETGDLQGIAAKFPDAKVLQNTWVAGGARGRRYAGQNPSGSSSATARVTLASGETIDGRLVRIDDFLVTIALADGTARTLRRDGEVPEIQINDSLKTHKNLLAVYTEKDMHDVTAYLATLK